MQWIEEKPNCWTFIHKCSNCGFRYSPKGNEDGTTDSPYRFCPKCGEKDRRTDNK